MKKIVLAALFTLTSMGLAFAKSKGKASTATITACRTADGQAKLHKKNGPDACKGIPITNKVTSAYVPELKAAEGVVTDARLLNGTAFEKQKSSKPPGRSSNVPSTSEE